MDSYQCSSPKNHCWCFHQCTLYSAGHVQVTDGWGKRRIWGTNFRISLKCSLQLFNWSVLDMDVNCLISRFEIDNSNVFWVFTFILNSFWTLECLSLLSDCVHHSAHFFFFSLAHLVFNTFRVYFDVTACLQYINVLHWFCSLKDFMNLLMCCQISWYNPQENYMPTTLPSLWTALSNKCFIFGEMQEVSVKFCHVPCKLLQIWNINPHNLNWEVT